MNAISHPGAGFVAAMSRPATKRIIPTTSQIMILLGLNHARAPLSVSRNALGSFHWIGCMVLGELSLFHPLRHRLRLQAELGGEEGLVLGHGVCGFGRVFRESLLLDNSAQNGRIRNMRTVVTIKYCNGLCNVYFRIEIEGFFVE